MEIVIFCGIQASGKSTFFKDTFFRTHVLISRDLLNTKNKETVFINTCFALQQRFVIDNTNPTKLDRAKYIFEAKEKKYKVIGYYFRSKLVDSLERNSHRVGKANVPEVGIKGTFKRLEVPSLDEGFDELYFVEIENNKFIVKEWNNEV